MKIRFKDPEENVVMRTIYTLDETPNEEDESADSILNEEYEKPSKTEGGEVKPEGEGTITLGTFGLPSVVVDPIAAATDGDEAKNKTEDGKEESTDAKEEDGEKKEESDEVCMQPLVLS